ncbi:hypothetical protein [Photorhabdus stackebrandtii]|uniref:Uncharacterized protein n=1 Tax=Photorhabdus stackebrandtii TaxID=1123042 RepID=A0A7X5QQY2_9GAMM|nr:hypothetical protein [Photorhabdus stackebrandtii]NHB98714.1 hypothetical protein [Photorhabdus stackebrandtii]
MPNYRKLLTQESLEMRARVIEQARKHENGGAFMLQQLLSDSDLKVHQARNSLRRGHSCPY